jgi:hypothetical protein
MKTLTRMLTIVAAAVAVLFCVCLVALHFSFDRRREFLAKAGEGQPIVGAINRYKEENGSYPVALDDLVPKYLFQWPETPSPPEGKFGGWDYRTVTNGTVVTYDLRYYMGTGGVEYQPPNWMANDEGHRTVILRNE